MDNTTAKKIIAVPTDFTERANCAISHAASIAKAGNAEILLIHVINRETKSKLKKAGADAELIIKKLKEECARIHQNWGIKATYAAPEGSIFTDIGTTTEESGAYLMVMGTHGVVGLEQKLLGAWALKVVTSSPAPVIIVQDKLPKSSGYEKIVFPVDYNKESKQMLFHIVSVAKTFNSEVLLFVANESDSFLARNVQANLAFAEKILKANKVAFSEHQQAPETDFNKELVKFAVASDADLMSIMSKKDNDIAAVILGDNEQKIINNEAQIPVMCVNPLHVNYDSNVVLNP